MTTTEPTTHEPAPVVLVPEVATSPEVLAKIERARQVLTLSGLDDLCREVYESVTPVIDPMLEGSDATLRAVSEGTGWGELYGLMVDLAGALMVAVGANPIDLGMPRWTTDEDAIRRERDTLADAAMARPELFLALMAEDGLTPEQLAGAGLLEQREAIRAAAERLAG